MDARLRVRMIRMEDCALRIAIANCSGQLLANSLPFFFQREYESIQKRSSAVREITVSC